VPTTETRVLHIRRARHGANDRAIRISVVTLLLIIIIIPLIA
jgi:hypothetical protein